MPKSSGCGSVGDHESFYLADMERERSVFNELLQFQEDLAVVSIFQLIGLEQFICMTCSSTAGTNCD